MSAEPGVNEAVEELACACGSPLCGECVGPESEACGPATLPLPQPRPLRVVFLRTDERGGYAIPELEGVEASRCLAVELGMMVIRPDDGAAVQGAAILYGSVDDLPEAAARFFRSNLPGALDRVLEAPGQRVEAPAPRLLGPDGSPLG